MKMNLNGPGTSLFQGNDLNDFDSLAQREEEEEAIEEQRRRDMELKNMLENVFDDVSFDNDEESVCNGSQNQSSASHFIFPNISNPDIDINVFNEVTHNRPINEFDTNCSSNHIEHFNTPLKHSSKNNQMNRVDFSNESENYSDQCRKKLHNGTLHDVVDASGGGGDAQSLQLNHCFKRSPLGDVVINGISDNTNNNMKVRSTEIAEDSSEQLKILYDVRVREVHRLTELIDTMRNEHQVEIMDLKRQIALLLAEKERANISQSQLQSLLVESKQQADVFTANINTLKKVNEELENYKKQLSDELQTANLTVNDLQRKVLVLEKGNKGKSEAVQYELNLKALTEKHNMEMLSVKNDLDKYIKNYDMLIKENEELKIKISNLSRINDENIAKKTEIINRLSNQVCETQKQYEHLMKSSTAEDNIRLQMEIKLLKEEKSYLNSKLDALEKENSRQEDELKQYESLSKISSFGSGFQESKDLDGSEMSGKLGAELYRALNGQKAKRLEIKNLQTQLDEKNEQISVMKENETLLRNEVIKLQEDIKKYLVELKGKEDVISLKESEKSQFHDQIEELKQGMKKAQVDFQSKYEELEKRNEVLQEKINIAEKEKIEAMSNYSEEYMRFHNEGLERVRGETEKYYKLEILKKDLEIENQKKEIDDIKNLYVDVYRAKESLLGQLEKEKNTSARSSGVDIEEVKKLQKELDKSRHRILELDQTLKQQYQQEVEILNLDINQLNLQVEKMKKEKDLEAAEKDRITVQNELLKSEVEQVTSEKNMLFLNYEKLEKEAEELRRSSQQMKESSNEELRILIEKHEEELHSLNNKYEMKIQKLKKEIESTLAKTVRSESKYTSPMKSSWSGTRNVASQRSPVLMDNKCTSPIRKISMQDTGTSPMSETKKGVRRAILKEPLSSRDISVITDPEPSKLSKKEVVQLMEKIGAHHEEEMKILEKKYRMELAKFDKKFQVEVDKAKELIQRELHKEHMLELEKLEEKHRLELENRIEQERKEAVVDVITEWACEVQSLKVNYAEAQAEMEKMKMKYKAAKSVALQYKTYFKTKAESMKEEWKKVEDGYEKALKELEKNVHILVDVKEDEVKTKVESITKIYEQKISKMKEKLSRCEDRLRAEKSNSRKREESSKSHDKFDFRKELEKLVVPKGNLYDACSLRLKKTKSNEDRTNYKFKEDPGSSTEEESEKNWKLERKNKYLVEKPSPKETISVKKRTAR